MWRLEQLTAPESPPNVADPAVPELPAVPTGSGDPAETAAPAAADSVVAGAPAVAPDRAPRRNRRASRPAAAGVDPTPSQHSLTDRAAEDKPEAWGDARPKSQPSAHDQELMRDRPPHWG